jgi:predicted dithiol-disulfide oxidoreductase (DUF899 family)
MTTTTHPTGTRQQWLAARLDLLAAEKDLTRCNDEITRRRLQLPWVPVEKEYRFDTDDGGASLAELFGGRSQLLVYHFMLGPGYESGCPSCSAIADGFNGIAVHLEHHDVGLVAVSRAPLDQIQAYRRRMGWTFRWASSHDSDFNYDFNTSFTEEAQRSGTTEYNYAASDMRAALQATEPGPHATMAGTDNATFMREAPGMSAFARQDDLVYHTYSAYARGLDALWGMYQWLDRAPFGRNDTGAWFRHHDRY